MRQPPPPKIECWTTADDKEIPIPPAEQGTDAEEVELEVKMWAALFRLRCACGERRDDWCNYDGATPVPR